MKFQRQTAVGPQMNNFDQQNLRTPEFPQH